MKETKYVVWNMRILKMLDNYVKKAIDSGLYASKVDFVRDSIRRRLRELELLQYSLDS